MDSKIETLLLDRMNEFNPKLSFENDAHKLIVSLDDKRAEIVWPNPIMEVFFDFWEDEEKVFSESLEYYDGENVNEVVNDIHESISRFLLNSTRLVKKGLILKITEFQYKKGDVWISVF